MKKYVLFFYSFVFLLAFSFSASAHVGSSGVILQKQAGKYQLLVSVQPPDVVPGTAKVVVFVEQGRATSIGARPIFFRSGDKGAPAHDELSPSGTGRFEGDLWLMDAGSSSIELTIDGPDGKQRVVVPVMSVATALRTMPEGTGIGLAVVKRIVTEHGWSIAVVDTVPRGATFRVTLGELSGEPVGTVPVKSKGRWTLSPGA